MIAAQKKRLASIDGNVKDLDSDVPADLVPVVSENWRSFFKWRGKGSMPSAEKEKLQTFVKQAHAHGRRLRLWAAPDNLATWQELYGDNVDLINTDHLEAAARFVRSEKGETTLRPR